MRVAIVMEKHIGNITVRIADDAYRDCTPEEMAKRRREFDVVVSRILAQPGAAERLQELNAQRYGASAD